MTVYIVGHLNPDTDAVVSAIVLEDLEKKLDKEYKATIASPINRETEYVLKRFGFEVPPMIPAEEGKKVILVDHNEPTQISPSVKPEEIQAIYDHHNLGGLTTPQPLTMMFKPLGSTVSLLAELYKEKGLEISKEIGSLIIAGIIADTVNFTSPITTEEDKKIAADLNKIAGLDADELAMEMFKAKSDISGMDMMEIVGKDYKIYSSMKRPVSIGTWETVLPESVLSHKEEIFEALKKKKAADKVDLIFFTIVDVLKGEAHMFVAGPEEEEVIKKAYNNPEIKDGIAYLPGVISRKKQMVPPIEGAL